MRRLEEFVRLMERWGPRLGLVAPDDLSRVWTRHVEDSLRLLPLLDLVPPGPCADVGSGGGFPGLPLAIAAPHRPWRLIEPRRRRAAFLEEAVRTLGLSCEVIAARAEAVAAGLGPAHALVTARALAPPHVAFPLLLPLVGKGGMAAVMIGAGARIPPEAEVWTEGIAIMRRETAQTGRGE